MKNDILPVRIGKKLPWLAVALLCLAGSPARAGDLTTDNLTVNMDATIYGNLLQTNAACSSPTNGIVFYFSFNVDTNPIPDDSGNGNTGSANGVTWTTNSISGGAYSFDGVSDDITLDSMANYDYGTEFSISLWFNTDLSVQYQRLISLTTGGGPNQLLLRTDGGQIFIQGIFGGEVDMTGSATLSPNTWYHVVVVRDGNNIYEYLDGSLDGSGSGVSGDFQPSDDFFIGSNHGAGENFEGTIDEVRLFNCALTASDVRGLYYGDQGATPPGNYAKFGAGVSYVSPLGDLSMGVYTNSP